jgi:hypothetical protein
MVREIRIVSKYQKSVTDRGKSPNIKGEAYQQCYCLQWNQLLHTTLPPRGSGSYTFESTWCTFCSLCGGWLLLQPMLPIPIIMKNVMDRSVLLCSAFSQKNLLRVLVFVTRATFCCYYTSSSCQHDMTSCMVPIPVPVQKIQNATFVRLRSDATIIILWWCHRSQFRNS